MSKRKNKNKSVVGTLLLIIGLLVLAYPFVSKFNLNNMNNNISSSLYKISISDEEKEQRQKAREQYNKSLLNGSFNAEGEITELELPKKQLLSGEFKPIGVLYVPRLEEDIPIYMGTSEDVLNIGVGIVENTSIPGTMGSNSVISGHRGTHNAQIFRHLDEMEEKDAVYVVMDKEIMKYIVTEIDIVQPNEASSIEISEDRDMVTLLTCTPYLINTERLLVICDRAELTQADRELFAEKFSGRAEEKNVEELQREAIIKTAIELCVLFILLVLILIVIPNKKNRKRKKENESKKQEILENKEIKTEQENSEDDDIFYL